MCQFCHLHLHTEYSLLDGVTKIRPLVQKVKDQGMDSCAITDHGVLYGCFEFWNTCKEFGVKPIIGCEVYVCEGSRTERQKTETGKNYYHLTLLAQNLQGYHNLLRMVSKGSTEGFYYKPRVDKELLQAHSQGLICLTGCPGSPINQNLLNGEFAKAEEWMEFIGNQFDTVYFELMRSKIDALKDLEGRQIKFNAKYNLPYVATVDSHYIEPDDWKIQELAWCIADGKKITDPDRRQYGSREFYIKNEQEMKELFADIPEAVENSQKIADMVEKYDITYARVQPKYHKLNKEETAKSKIKELTYQGAEARYQTITPELKERIDYELEVIDSKGYNDYFLIVYDYCNWAREQDIMVGPGRGSGGGSVVAYCLKITNIDPIRYDLLFERFLNPERDSPPDFDIDFQDDRRDELFEYMSRTYGEQNTSFIGTFGRLKTKAAIRDVARSMGIDLSLADKLSKMVIVKFGRVHSIDRMIDEVFEFRSLIETSPQLQELCGYVRKLENIARHVSTHACGFLVTPEPIIEYVPVQRETKGGQNIITQIEGWVIEYLGLMKFDFLGLSNLTIIKNALEQIQKNRGEKIDIDHIPEGDSKTYELFQQGNTTGVFQFESEGMKKYLRDLKPTEFEDLIFMTSAYRPGPMQYIPDYILRKRGEQPVSYPDPSVENILKSTYGFAIYQEQVMQVAVEYAGYSLGQADVLRRAMGKKKPEIMAKEKEVFIAAAQKLGKSAESAAKVFSYLEPFADYGFNRSHAAAYSIISYQTAYLKANYPLEFMAGIMQTDMGNADKTARDLIECREMNIKVLPPDINKSEVKYKIEDKKYIRFGLGGIKNISEKIMYNVVNEREKGGEFKNIDDFIKRLGTKNITKKDTECLIKVGALDSFGERNALITVLPAVFEKVQIDETKSQGGQTGLFSLLEQTSSSLAIESTPLPAIRRASTQDKILWERELLGTFISSHPLDRYTKALLHSSIDTIGSALAHRVGQKVKLLGIITTKRTILTKKDAKTMAFLTLEDMDSKLDAVVFPDTYLRLIEKINEFSPLVISGELNMRNDIPSLVVEDIIPAKDVPSIDHAQISLIGVYAKDDIEELKDLIRSNPGDLDLKILYGSPSQHYQITKKINPTPRLIQVIKKFQG